MPEIVKNRQVGPIKIKLVCNPAINYGRIELTLSGKVIFRKEFNTSRESCEEHGVIGGSITYCTRINQNNDPQFKVDLHLLVAHGSTGWIDMAVFD